MSDDVKDFAYYASQAEEYLQLSRGYDLEGLRTLISDETMNRHIMRADVLARLACGAPKAAPSGVCPSRLFPVPPNGEFKICVLGAGHIGDHLTGGGVHFHD